MRKTSRLIAVIALLTFGVGAFFTGCDWFDDDGVSQPMVPMAGLEFTDDNMVEAAGLGAAVSRFITGFGGITVDILFGLLADDVGPTGARPMVPVPVDICLNAPDGTATADWTDADLSGDLSTGDTVLAAFDNCLISGAALTGTVTLDFDDEVDLALFPVGTAEISTEVNLSVDDGSDTIAFTGDFHISYLGTLNTFDFVIGDGSVGELMTFSDGEDTVQFGCFDSRLTYDEENVLLSPRGVVNFNNLIMQLGDYGVPVDPDPLVFAVLGFDVAEGPYDGQMKQLSFDDRPNQLVPLEACSAVGSTIHSGSTSLLVEATSGDPFGVTYPITIDRFDNDSWTPPPATSVDTFWEDL